MNIAQRNAARNMYEGQGKQVNEEEEEGNSSSSLCPVCALLLFNKIFFFDASRAAVFLYAPSG